MGDRNVEASPAAASPTPASRREAWNAATSSVRPVEATTSSAFASRRSLLAHARKHVFWNRAEGWKDLLGAERVSSARREDADNDRSDAAGSDAVREVAVAYQKIASEALLFACSTGAGHAHSAGFSPSDDGESFSVARHSIVVWDRSKLLLVVAVAQVSAGGPAPYRLRTAYRVPSHRSPTTFAQRSLERFRERARTRGEIVVAIHDDGARESESTQGPSKG